MRRAPTHEAAPEAKAGEGETDVTKEEEATLLPSAKRQRRGLARKSAFDVLLRRKVGQTSFSIRCDVVKGRSGFAFVHAPLLTPHHKLMAAAAAAVDPKKVAAVQLVNLATGEWIEVRVKEGRGDDFLETALEMVQQG